MSDFNAMNAAASPHGRGGGARHVVLGLSAESFPIERFLEAHGQQNVTIQIAGQPGQYSQAPLSFAGNRNRRGGEWLIRDQYNNRHPAWSEATGFPAAYDPADPPYLLIFHVGRNFHARFALDTQLRRLSPRILPRTILTEQKGIDRTSAQMLTAFNIPPPTLLEAFEEAEQTNPEMFDPTNVSDGRQRVFAAVLQRLGQQSFRKKLLVAYRQRCAMTGCRTLWVLEAAHITPYRGIKTNAVTNGLLLRADIHTLFDLGLISIEPSEGRIHVSSRLKGSKYTGLHGKVPLLPLRPTAHPSPAALRKHFSQFQI
jgi:HNH endonuclease